MRRAEYAKLARRPLMPSRLIQAIGQPAPKIDRNGPARPSCERVPNERSTKSDGCTQAQGVARAAGRPAEPPGDLGTDPRVVSPLPRVQAGPPRLSELRLLPGPTRDRDQEDYCAGRDRVLTESADR